MPGFSTYLEGALLGWLKGTALPPAPAAVWLGLWNGDPGDGGSGGAEVTTAIRPGGRVAVPFGAVSAGAMSNGGAIDFGPAAGPATVSHFALFDAGSGGNLLMSGPLGGGAQAVAAGNGVGVAAGALSVTVG
jgi:hypothetical protein